MILNSDVHIYQVLKEYRSLEMPQTYGNNLQLWIFMNIKFLTCSLTSASCLHVLGPHGKRSM